MQNSDTIFVNILDLCKKFSKELVNEYGNIPRVGVILRFSDLEVVTLTLAAEALSINSENYLFAKLKEYASKRANLISHRQFNDRRKKLSRLCEEIRKLVAIHIDSGEDKFCIDSKPIEVCRVVRGKQCKIGRDFNTSPNLGYCASQGAYCYGYKLHAVCGLSGIIHSYDKIKASVHDIKYLNDIKYEYSNCHIFDDRGYISKTIQLDLFEIANRHLIRVIGKINAFTFLQYINYINNKRIDRVKYDLSQFR